MLSYVRDGDKGSIKPGYHLLKIVARCPSGVKSFPLLSRLFSVDEEVYLSENDEIIKSIDACKQAKRQRPSLGFLNIVTDL